MSHSRTISALCGCAIAAALCACTERDQEVPRLGWYVYDERSGAFEEAARRCTSAAAGRYVIELAAQLAEWEQKNG